MRKTALYRIVYISHSNIQEKNLEATLTDIQIIADKKNPLAKVSGELIYFNCMFIQTLEGTEANTKSLMDTISKDNRHSGITTLFSGEVSQRYYPNWSQMRVTVKPWRLKGLIRYLEEVASFPQNTMTPSSIRDIFTNLSKQV